MTTIASPLAEEARKAAGDALQNALVDLIDLSLLAKQAHWTVVGRNFRSLHLQLDEIAVTESHDAVTQDLFLDITAGLEKQYWMFQAESLPKPEDVAGSDADS